MLSRNRRAFIAECSGIGFMTAFLEACTHKADPGSVVRGGPEATAAAERVWTAIGKGEPPVQKDFDLVRGCCLTMDAYPDSMFGTVPVDKGRVQIEVSETFGMVTLRQGSEWRYFSPETCTIARGTNAEETRLANLKERDMGALHERYIKAPENQSDVPLRIVRPKTAPTSACPGQ